MIQTIQCNLTPGKEEEQGKIVKGKIVKGKLVKGKLVKGKLAKGKLAKREKRVRKLVGNSMITRS